MVTYTLLLGLKIYIAFFKSLAMHCKTGHVQYLENAFITSASRAFFGGKGGEVGLSWQVQVLDTQSGIGGSHIHCSLCLQSEARTTEQA